MQQSIQKAAVLIEALPYIREFAGKTVVIKYGGAAMRDPALRHTTAQDIALMKCVGMNPVVVHGGGPAITKNLDRLGIKSEFKGGLRVTGDDAIEVVEMVLAGSVNKDIVGLLNMAGGRAVGLCGKDGGLLFAARLTAENSPEDLGHVGRVVRVDTKVIETLCGADMIPVIAPLAAGPEGGTLNINADTAAGEIAAALQAEKLVFLTDTPGLLEDVDRPESLMHQLRSSDVGVLKEKGVIAGGMIPKVDACLKALDFGVQKTHIIDGRVKHSLLLEIFTQEGLGTLVSHDR